MDSRESARLIEQLQSFAVIRRKTKKMKKGEKKVLPFVITRISYISEINITRTSLGNAGRNVHERQI